MRTLPGLKNWFLAFAALFLAFVLVSCGSGSVSTNTGQTGSVALLLTDAATDDFAEVNVTITRAELISDSLKVTILSTTKTVDLLKLEDETSLFALSSGVPSGWYNKIRLYVSDVELVKHDSTKIYPKLPGGWKIDLNPREAFFVKPGGTLLLQVDLDANKSIHVVKTGVEDKYIFRPVIFIDILKGSERGKLLRLYGQVRNIDSLSMKFELCPPETIYRAAVTTTASFVDAERNVTTCVPVYASTSTSFFDINGDPAVFGDLAENDLITAVGNIRIDTHSASGDGYDLDVMGLDAVVIEWGKFLRLSGIVMNAPDPATRVFDFELYPGQGFPTGTITRVELQSGAKVYSMAGTELTEADITPGLKARIDGVLSLSDTSPDTLKAALAVLYQNPFTALNKIEGMVMNLSATGLTFDLYDPATSTTECVVVENTTSIFLITTDASGYASTEITPGDIANTQSLQVYGGFISSGCFSAQTILASPL